MGRARRRGAAVVAVVVLLVIVELLILGLVLSGARDQELTIHRIDTVQAFYAAEAGINMSIRERMMMCDEDGDGTVGTISDDADSGTDPTLGNASFYTTESLTGATYTQTSYATAGSVRRDIESDAQ